MEAVVAGLVGAAGGTYAARKSNKYASQAFTQRMKDAEKYGIHPLQALGGNANFQGSGGLNIGDVVNQARALKKAQQYQDDVREDQQAHEKVMQHIKERGEDQRLQKRLEADAKSPFMGDNIIDFKNKAAKYWGPAWGPIIDTFTDAGDWVEDRWDQIRNDLYDATIGKNLTIKD